MESGPRIFFGITFLISIVFAILSGVFYVYGSDAPVDLSLWQLLAIASGLFAVFWLGIPFFICLITWCGCKSGVVPGDGFGSACKVCLGDIIKGSCCFACCHPKSSGYSKL